MGSVKDVTTRAPVAVLMLCHKHPEHALASIESMQGERDLIDRIFVGDNSCDTQVTKLLDASDLDFEHVVFEANTGFAGGINALTDIARSSCEAEYFLILNDDTLLEPNCLANLLAEARPDLIASPMIVASDDQRTVIQSAGDFDRDLVRFNHPFAGLDRAKVPPGVHEVELTDGCCFLIHRQWSQAGFRMDPDFFMYFEDVEYFLRLRSQQVRFAFVTSAVVQHRKSSSTGGPNSTSALREYYFCRNRLILARRLHTGTKRWRVYAVLARLAVVNWWGFRRTSPEAARAIRIAFVHFFRGRRGAYSSIHNR